MITDIAILLTFIILNILLIVGLLFYPRIRKHPHWMIEQRQYKAIAHIIAVDTIEEAKEIADIAFEDIKAICGKKAFPAQPFFSTRPYALRSLDEVREKLKAEVERKIANQNIDWE